MWTPNYFGALAGNGGTQLLVTPVQHRAANVDRRTSTQRKHTGMNLRLFYSGNLSQAALSDAPSIVAVDAQLDASGVAFSAQVVGDPAAAIYQVWVTYTGDGTNAWTSLDLSQCVAPLPARVRRQRRLAAVEGPAGEPARQHQVLRPGGERRRPRRAQRQFRRVFRDRQRHADGDDTRARLAAVQRDRRRQSHRHRQAHLCRRRGLAGKIVAVGVGGAARLGTTGSDGSVTVKMPVVADPGNYQITAAFAGDEVFQPSSASTPLTINRAAATPTVLPPSAATRRHQHLRRSRRQRRRSAAGAGGVHRDRSGRHDDGLLDHRLSRQRDLPAAVGSAAGKLHGDPGIVRRRRHVRADDDHVPDAAAGLGPEARTRASRSTRSPDKTFGDPDFPLFATASSGLAVSFGASGACTVAGSTVHLTGAGNCTITADQAGDATYNAAATVLAELRDRRADHAADRVVAGARRAESDDGRHRHLHADVQRSGHRRHGEQFRGRHERHHRGVGRRDQRRRARRGP